MSYRNGKAYLCPPKREFTLNELPNPLPGILKGRSLFLDGVNDLFGVGRVELPPKLRLPPKLLIPVSLPNRLAPRETVVLVELLRGVSSKLLFVLFPKFLSC